MSLFDILGGSGNETTNSSGANFGYGYDSSHGVSGSSSQSSSSDYGSNIWGPQQNYLTGMWGLAARMLGLPGLGGGGGSPWSQGPGNFGGPRSSGGLTRHMSPGLQMPGYGDGRNDPTRSYRGGTPFSPGIYRGTGQEYYQGAQGAASALGQGLTGAQNTLTAMQNPGQDPMMNVYARQIGQQFREQIMPALQGGANLGGMRGSSRQGVAEGLAAGRAQQQLQDFGAQLYNQNQNRRLAAAQTAGDWAQTGAGLQAQMAPLQAALAFSAPWFNLQQFQGILGSPIMQDLGGESSSSSSSFGSESSFGENVSFGAESSSGKKKTQGGLMPDISLGL